jgi:hypothetical protein
MIGFSSDGAEVLEKVQGISGSVPSDSESTHNDLATALSCPFQMRLRELGVFSADTICCAVWKNFQKVANV